MKRFDVVIVNFDPSVGHEIKKTRPCVIVSPDEMNAVLKTIQVVPVTSTIRTLPTRILIKACPKSGLDHDSQAALDQLKTIDKSRVQTSIGEISENEIDDIVNTLLKMFSR